jgi:hypothetical protein
MKKQLPLIIVASVSFVAITILSVLLYRTKTTNTNYVSAYKMTLTSFYNAKDTANCLLAVLSEDEYSVKVCKPYLDTLVKNYKTHNEYFQDQSKY